VSVEGKAVTQGYSVTWNLLRLIRGGSQSRTEHDAAIGELTTPTPHPGAELIGPERPSGALDAACR